MRYAFVAGLGLMMSVAVATPSQAFGDRCYTPIKETGEASTLRGAMAEARKCWESDIRGRFGARAANWYYSADRSFNCSWNADGTWFKCVAQATACERRH